MLLVAAGPLVNAVDSLDSHGADAAEVVERVRRRLEAVTSGRCELLVVRRRALTLSVIVWSGSRRLDLEADLRDPDVDLKVASRVACFLERDDT